MDREIDKGMDHDGPLMTTAWIVRNKKIDVAATWSLAWDRQADS